MLELSEIERALQEAFPELEVAPLRDLGLGFGSRAVETRDGVIFRVARHAAAAAGHRREQALLPALRPRLPLALPEPRWVIDPGTEGLVHGAIGYHRIEGHILTPAAAKAHTDSLAGDMAAFLVALHRFPVHEAEQLGLPHADTNGRAFSALRDEVIPLVLNALSRSELNRLLHWCDDFAADTELDRFAPAVRHGDLWFGNVLVDDTSGRLAAILDWGNAAIGDPAWDLARQLHLGERFAAAVLDAYESRLGRDTATRRRIRRRWELLEFEGIPTAASLDDPNEFAETIEKLRAGPIFRERWLA